MFRSAAVVILATSLAPGCSKPAADRPAEESDAKPSSPAPKRQQQPSAVRPVVAAIQASFTAIAREDLDGFGKVYRPELRWQTAGAELARGQGPVLEQLQRRGWGGEISVTPLRILDVGANLVVVQVRVGAVDVVWLCEVSSEQIASVREFPDPTTPPSPTVIPAAPPAIPEVVQGEPRVADIAATRAFYEAGDRRDGTTREIVHHYSVGPYVIAEITRRTGTVARPAVDVFRLDRGAVVETWHYE